MRTNIAPNSGTASKLIAFYGAILVFVALCGFIVTRNLQDCSEGSKYSTREQHAKTSGNVNDMLFSLKSFILFE